MSKKHSTFLFFIFVCTLLVISIAYAATDSIDEYVVDNAHVFDSETRAQLNDALKELETTSGGIQIVVFTEDKLPDGMTLEERSLELAEKHGIGSSNSDNGLLFYIATNDGQFRWEVGYGLESQLNSAKLGRVSRDYMIPKFKEGNFQDGIIAGLAQIEDLLIGNQTSDTKVLGSNESRSYDGSGMLLLILLFFMSNPIIMILAIMLIIYIIKLILRKKGIITDDTHFINAASNLFTYHGRGGSFGGGFSGGGGHFGGGGFSGRF